MTDHPSAPLAELRGAHKHHGRVHALRGVDLQVHPGELVALLGGNGAGKSTSIGLLLGLHRPEAGLALLDGRAPQALASRRGIGVMLQAAGLPDTLRVDELLDQVRRYYPAPRSMADCAALAGIGAVLRQRYGRLSGGQQRAVQFALAICGRPRLLFLDEPTTGLDVGARQQVWAAVREMVADGCGVLLTTHYLEEAEALADRVVVLHRGAVLSAGGIDEVRARVARAQIRCRTRLAATEVAAWDGVEHAVEGRHGLEITAAHAEPVVARLLQHDPALQALEVRRAALADALAALTAEAA